MAIRRFTGLRFGLSVGALAAANALQAVLAIALLPLATRILDAADFGAYALVMSIVTLAAALSDGGGALALPAHYGPANQQARGQMVATFAAVSGGLGLAISACLLALWPWEASIASVLGAHLPASVWLACAALVPLRALATTSTVVFTVSGRGFMLAWQSATQALATFAVAVFALLTLHLGLMSLFVAAIAGQIGALAVAIVALRADLLRRPTRRWFAVAYAHAPTAAFAGITDGLRAFAENALIGRASGLRQIAYYSHARLYYNLGITASNAISHNVWSLSLNEAREQNRSFRRTGLVWEGVHLAVFLGGIGSVALGREVIEVLTHGVLTPAADYLPWLFATLLVHLSGRAAVASLFASGHAAAVTRVRIGLGLVVLVSLPFIISRIGGFGLSLGIKGVIGVTFFEAVIYRLYLRRRAAALGELPFQDFWALVGVIGIVSTATLDLLVHPRPPWKIGAFVVVAVGAFILDWARGGPVRTLASLRRP